MEWECGACGHTWGGDDNKPSLWIKTTDMPEDQISFHALFVTNGNGKTGWYYPTYKGFGDGIIIYDKSEVTHYMPYPELPKDLNK